MSRQLRSLPLATIPELSLKERGDGSGVIVFGTDLSMGGRRGLEWQTLSSPGVVTFELSADAREVYEIAREAQRAVKGVG